MIPSGHVKAGQIGQAAVVAGVAFVAGDHVFLGRHHMGNGKDIGGVHEVKFSRKGNVQGFIALGEGVYVICLAFFEPGANNLP